MPLAIAALGLGAAGTGLQVAGNMKAQSAMNNVRTQEAQRQAELQKQNSAIYSKSLAASTPQVAAQQMQAGQNARESAWNQLQKSTVPVASALPATGGATGKASARTGAAANVWNNLTANANAKQGSYDDWNTQQAIKNANAAQNESIINNFSEGDARLMPTELAVAGQAGDKLSGWGSIVSTLGSLAGLAGATGAFGAAKTAASTAPTSIGGSAVNWANGDGIYNSIAAGGLPNTGLSTAGMFGTSGMSPAAWANLY